MSITSEALYAGLLRFERDLHEHVRLEYSVLFPRVVGLAAHTAPLA
jgi:iron-sulfur cluster repair protein YtfE (RIC family)